MVEIIKPQFGNIYAIKCMIMNKNNGFNGPGAFVFKNDDKALFVGYSADLSTYLSSEVFKPYTLVGYHGEGIKYTQIEQYLTENNYLAASLAALLRESMRPTENKEEFIRSKWDIRGICENYEREKPEARYEINRHLSLMLGEEKFNNNFRQKSIVEAWG